MKNHEFLYGSMNIKIPESIFYVLVEDCHRFGFIKNDEANFSGYINDIIPKLSKMREEKHNTILKYNDYDENLTRIIEKNIYNVYLKEFDLEDDNIGDLSFRINNKSRDEFIYIHDNLLELFDLDFTNYVRSLLKEYSIKPVLKRDLCYFYNELDNINEAINSNRLIKVYNKDGEIYEIVPIALEQCYKKETNYLIGSIEDKTGIWIIALDSISRISYLNKIIELSDEDITGMTQEAYDKIYKEDEC